MLQASAPRQFVLLFHSLEQQFLLPESILAGQFRDSLDFGVKDGRNTPSCQIFISLMASFPNRFIRSTFFRHSPEP
jgi:hypothetical protein